jgi:hypothetical protein
MRAAVTHVRRPVLTVRSADRNDGSAYTPVATGCPRTRGHNAVDGHSEFLGHVTDLLALEVSRPARRGDTLLCLRPLSSGLPLKAWQMLQIGEDEREQLGMIREVQEGAVILCVPLLHDYFPGERVTRHPQPAGTT